MDTALNDLPWTRSRRLRETAAGGWAEAGRRPRIVIVGGGYAGLYAALRLQSKLRRGEAAVTVIDPNPYMTYQPFLPEAAAGAIEPRHVVAALRGLLPSFEVLTGHVKSVDAARRSLRVDVTDEHGYDVDYDLLAVAAGSVARTLPVPGLDREGVGFRSLGEAIYLRNHVLGRLDQAASARDPLLRQRLLTFVFVGGGYAGVEALGGLEEMSRFAVRRYFRSIEQSDLRWVLVEAMDRIMPEVSRSLAEYSVDVLRARGVDVRLNTTVTSVEGGHVVLADGSGFDAGTVVWTAGVAPSPMLADTDLPLDEKGRVRCLPTLRVEGQARVFAAGDCAAVPDLARAAAGDDGSAGEGVPLCAPTAQHAMRQGRQLGDNLLALIRGRPLAEYRHASAGSVASFGRHDGVAEVYGVKVKGWPAWLLHRAYHLSKMPTVNRRARILADWALGVPFPRQIVALGELHEPREQFARATRR